MNDFTIVNYHKQYAAHFERLNTEWISNYFVVEPIDKYVLENPDKAIIERGGTILFLKSGADIIGTVALMPAGAGVFELTKMAVAPESRGVGAGRLLCQSAIEKASELGAEKVILYSNRRLENAIALYRKLGFKEIPLEPGVYERADIKMEFLPG